MLSNEPVLVSVTGMLVTVIVWLGTLAKTEVPAEVATAIAGLIVAGLTWYARSRVTPTAKLP